MLKVVYSYTTRSVHGSYSQRSLSGRGLDGLPLVPLFRQL